MGEPSRTIKSCLTCILTCTVLSRTSATSYVHLSLRCDFSINSFGKASFSATPVVVQLRVEGEGLRTIELSLKDLRTKFKRHTISATLQCAGNRRTEMSSLKDIKGTTWASGAPSAASPLYYLASPEMPPSQPPAPLLILLPGPSLVEMIPPVGSFWSASVCLLI